jgi:hypothetical protein
VKLALAAVRKRNAEGAKRIHLSRRYLDEKISSTLIL